MEAQMKRFLRISLAVVAVLMMSAMPGQAERIHGGGGGHGWGMGWGPVVGLGLGLGLLGLTYPYYGNPYYPGYSPAPVIQEPSPEIYLAPGRQQSAAQNFWYFCQDPEGYYPYVKQCPGGWMKVVPAPPQQ